MANDRSDIPSECFGQFLRNAPRLVPSVTSIPVFALNNAFTETTIQYQICFKSTRYGRRYRIITGNHILLKSLADAAGSLVQAGQALGLVPCVIKHRVN